MALAVISLREGDLAIKGGMSSHSQGDGCDHGQLRPRLSREWWGWHWYQPISFVEGAISPSEEGRPRSSGEE